MKQSDQVVLDAGVLLVAILRGVQLVLHVLNHHFRHYFFHDLVEITKVSYRAKHFPVFCRKLLGCWGNEFPFVCSRPMSTLKTTIDDVSEWNTERMRKFFDNLCRNVSRGCGLVCFNLLQILPNLKRFVMRN